LHLAARKSVNLPARPIGVAKHSSVLVATAAKCPTFFE
jgi:hypothetical protein